MRERRGTHIRAVRVPEEHDNGMSAKPRKLERTSVLVDQREVRRDDYLRAERPPESRNREGAQGDKRYVINTVADRVTN